MTEDEATDLGRVLKRSTQAIIDVVNPDNGRIYVAYFGEYDVGRHVHIQLSPRPTHLPAMRSERELPTGPGNERGGIAAYRLLTFFDELIDPAAAETVEQEIATLLNAHPWDYESHASVCN
ncbi:MAG TPA: hypothetical protein VN886_07860 [Acidimicrobiales bacterium]|nr:hypothetical protein [Acidimicrobiales bacterium]